MERYLNKKDEGFSSFFDKFRRLFEPDPPDGKKD